MFHSILFNTLINLFFTLRYVWSAKVINYDREWKKGRRGSNLKNFMSPVCVLCFRVWRSLNLIWMLTSTSNENWGIQVGEDLTYENFQNHSIGIILQVWGSLKLFSTSIATFYENLHTHWGRSKYVFEWHLMNPHYNKRKCLPFICFLWTRDKSKNGKTVSTYLTTTRKWYLYFIINSSLPAASIAIMSLWNFLCLNFFSNPRYLNF